MKKKAVSARWSAERRGTATLWGKAVL
uniref:Uncharacterized protein n=1 Tax=Arundo donax TaxID=35708 RepID=A0A0A8XR32_ARUDO